GPGDVWLVTKNAGTIASEALPSLFDPFKRAQVAGSRGLGLGLYITKLIVAAHGGTIEVGPDAQETKFELQLPRAASASAPVARCAWAGGRRDGAGAAAAAASWWRGESDEKRPRRPPASRRPA